MFITLYLVQIPAIISIKKVRKLLKLAFFLYPSCPTFVATWNHVIDISFYLKQLPFHKPKSLPSEQDAVFPVSSTDPKGCWLLHANIVLTSRLSTQTTPSIAESFESWIGYSLDFWVRICWDTINCILVWAGKKICFIKDWEKHMSYMIECLSQNKNWWMRRASQGSLKWIFWSW